VMVVGLLDDLWRFKPLLKLISQLVAASILVLFGVRLECLAMDGPAIILTILWVVGMANAFNFIDIMDGLAAGVSCIAALAFLAITLPGQDNHVLLASAAMAGSSLAFLRYNWQPAKIFMGDAGSQFIGFFLAAIALGASYTQTTNVALFVPLLILGVPIFDTLLVVILRTLRGVPFFMGSDDHLALRLKRRGLSVPQVVLVLYLVSGLLASCAVMITRLSTERAIFVYVCIGMTLLVVGQIVAEIPAADKKRRGKK
jgi:UDP-GlcNAc:undecaprenyl-phosphate GlcNAc-1-phosphate transferase